MPTVTVNSNYISTYVKAGSSTTSEDILNVLAMSELPIIRMRVAENPNTPKQTLTELAKDECPEVRIATATNPNTPHQVVTALAKDADLTVRICLAQEITTRKEVLKLLFEDENPYVMIEATKTLDILEQKSRHGNVRKNRPRNRRLVAEGKKLAS